MKVKNCDEYKIIGADRMIFDITSDAESASEAAHILSAIRDNKPDTILLKHQKELYKYYDKYSLYLDNMFVSFVKLKVKMTNIDTDIQSEMVQKIEKFSKSNKPFLRALVIIACKPIIGENKNNSIY